MYPPDQMPVAKTPAGDLDDIPQPALASRRRDMDEKLQREALQAYFASITFMDQQVGKLLDALDRLKLTDKTIVVFHSDHGYHLGEHDCLWQKQSLFEESARVPLVIAGPGVKAAGKSTAAISELIDVYPTLAELCGLEAAPGIPGESLVPQLSDPDASGKGFAITQVRRGGGAMGKGKNKNKAADPAFLGYSIRVSRWRYTEWDGGQKGAELYDHDNDPQEFTNLAKDPKHAEVVRRLQGELREIVTSAKK
jgi:arylsulfatase A-like enzyme